MFKLKKGPSGTLRGGSSSSPLPPAGGGSGSGLGSAPQYSYATTGGIMPTDEFRSIIGPLTGGIAKIGQKIDNAAGELGQNKLNHLADDEAIKRHLLGVQQQGQINDFATQQEGAVSDYRKLLAQHLSDTAQQTFQQANPGILEDLNSRGLFTSQTARDDSQGRALQQLATQQQQQLSNFDTGQFNNLQDIRGSGLSALLGGDQSALDSALELRKAGIQRSFDVADQQRQQAFAQTLAQQQQRQQLMGSILGLGGSLGAAYLGGL